LIVSNTRGEVTSRREENGHGTSREKGRESKSSVRAGWKILESHGAKKTSYRERKTTKHLRDWKEKKMRSSVVDSS